MAEAFNPQGLKGNVNKINYYTLYGKTYARKALEISREKYLNSPSYQLTRENNQEMAGCAVVGSAIKVAFSGIYQNMADSLFHSRNIAVLRKICKLANGVRGERPINISEHRELLLDKEFNKKDEFKSIFNAPIQVTISADRVTSTLTMLPCKPNDYIFVPKNATHFRLVVAAACVSDYQFNETSKVYYPVDAINDKLGAFTFSDYISVKDEILAPVTINAAFLGAPVLTANSSVITAIGVIYYQQVDLTQYKYAQCNSMKIKLVS
ncbi:MAG: hypothetical protein Q8880_08100 [Bacteroidota bacterium]|nr:hypothetical protein [Bacteroidota bacterium]